jgi:hypothetical protein
VSIPGLFAPAAVMALVAGLGAFGVAAQGFEPARRDAERLARKITRIQTLAQRPAEGERPPVRTVLTEAEINAYLFWHREGVLPAGVTESSMSLAGDGHVSAAAVVDLETMRSGKARGWLDPLAYIGGRVPVTAAGVIHARDGVATLDLVSASVAGVAVPKSVLQELLSFYTRSADDPDGISLDDPFPLPAAIREVMVGNGEATVVQ